MIEYILKIILCSRMAKTSIKYLLILCILLWSVINQLATFTQQGSVSALLQKSLPTSRYICPETTHPTSVSSFSIENKESNLLYFEEDKTEDDDDHCVFQKKQLNKNSSFATLFHNWKHLSILLNFPQVLLAYKHFTFFAPNKLFVIFGVFRI